MAALIMHVKKGIKETGNSKNILQTTGMRRYSISFLLLLYDVSIFYPLSKKYLCFAAERCTFMEQQSKKKKATKTKQKEKKTKLSHVCIIFRSTKHETRAVLVFFRFVFVLFIFILFSYFWFLLKILPVDRAERVQLFISINSVGGFVGSNTYS